MAVSTVTRAQDLALLLLPSQHPFLSTVLLLLVTPLPSPSGLPGAAAAAVADPPRRGAPQPGHLRAAIRQPHGPGAQGVPGARNAAGGAGGMCISNAGYGLRVAGYHEPGAKGVPCARDPASGLHVSGTWYMRGGWRSGFRVSLLRPSMACLHSMIVLPCSSQCGYSNVLFPCLCQTHCGTRSLFVPPHRQPHPYIPGAPRPRRARLGDQATTTTTTPR